jgi:hypothetical protein
MINSALTGATYDIDGGAAVRGWVDQTTGHRRCAKKDTDCACAHTTGNSESRIDRFPSGSRVVHQLRVSTTGVRMTSESLLARRRLVREIVSALIVILAIGVVLFVEIGIIARP